MTATHPSAPVDRRDIAVGYDASHESRHALRWAAEEAEASGHRLAVVTVVEPGRYGLNPGAPLLRRFLFAEAHRIADPALGRVRTAHPHLDARVVVRIGSAATVLDHVGTEAAMLVLGVRPRPVATRLVFGSVAQQVLRTLRTPVVLVPRREDGEGAESPHGRRVLAVVGPAAGTAAVRFALAGATTSGGHLTIVRAVGAHPSVPAGHGFGAAVDAALADADGDAARTRVEVECVERTVGEVVRSDTLAGHSLLVLGSHEPGEARWLLGERAVAAVLAHPRLPVAVVPDDASPAVPAPAGGAGHADAVPS